MNTTHFFDLLFILVFSASAVFAQKTELAGTKWQLTHIDGNAVSAPNTFIEINGDKTKFTGHTGCNRMFGSVDSHGGQMSFDGVGTTKMACTHGKVALIERNFLAELDKVNGFQQKGDELELLDGSRLALKFKATKAVDKTNLEGRKWILKSVKGTDLTLSKEIPFIKFDSAKTSVGGNTGCNVFGGTYKTTGNSLMITDTISTMRACEEENRMAIERQLLDGLQAADRFEITDGTLRLFKKDELLLEFKAEIN